MEEERQIVSYDAWWGSGRVQEEGQDYVRRCEEILRRDYVRRFAEMGRDPRERGSRGSLWGLKIAHFFLTRGSFDKFDLGGYVILKSCNVELRT